VFCFYYLFRTKTTVLLPPSLSNHYCSCVHLGGHKSRLNCIIPIQEYYCIPYLGISHDVERKFVSTLQRIGQVKIHTNLNPQCRFSQKVISNRYHTLVPFEPKEHLAQEYAFFGVADSEQVNGSTNKLNGSQEIYALVEVPILCTHLQLNCDVELALVALNSLSLFIMPVYYTKGKGNIHKNIQYIKLVQVLQTSLDNK
jgi:hypothetical protein